MANCRNVIKTVFYRELEGLALFPSRTNIIITSGRGVGKWRRRFTEELSKHPSMLSRTQKGHRPELPRLLVHDQHSIEASVLAVSVLIGKFEWGDDIQPCLSPCHSGLIGSQLSDKDPSNTTFREQAIVSPNANQLEAFYHLTRLLWCQERECTEEKKNIQVLFNNSDIFYAFQTNVQGIRKIHLFSQLTW